ncbi:major facilitator superfamily domain-containing protein [Apodospora peruviana]|uniref:Major facilitator superfamily domain-containing protein n=1 Tax=Apodospora peruviana TaxID=516989 RepID=A0AAE0HWP0_9PEZI|nr:major facilitator superfamily domain-containing protein [Apodospora peruviana]
MSITKDEGIVAVAEAKTPLDLAPTTDVDNAWEYLDHHRDANLKDPIDLHKLRRKIDWRIVPLMFCAYTIQFLDKIILNYASVMSIREDLNLQGNDFTNLATFLFVGQAAFEIPNIYFLQKFPSAKWLAFNIICWGIATGSAAAAKTYQTLLVSRVFLGIFEATIAPSLMLISSQWYTKSEQAPRFSFWLLGLGMGQILGGAVSYGFQNIAPGTTAIAGWRIMFLVLGVVTVIIGICVLILLPDTPMKARWLTDNEKIALLKHVSVNQTGIENTKFRPKEIVEALCDPQIWLLLISILQLSNTGGIVAVYSATLIRNLGYDPKQAVLMNMPCGAVSIIFCLLTGYGIRKQSHRWAFILACIFPGMIGSGLMSFLPVTNKVGILAGIYLVNAVVAPLFIFYNWTVCNVAGATKRAFAVSAFTCVFSIGNIISPQTFQARDAPEYRPAKITVLATQAGAALTTFLLFLYYVWQNKSRNSSESETEEAFMSPEVWTRMTDRENKRFRYTY